ncbi:MAG: hypothetical protein AAFY71_23235 [Bacteroidota bacterium]
MAEEEIKRLQSEIESLRKENEELKIAAFQYIEENEGRDLGDSLVIEKEPILKVLGDQLSFLKKVNLQVIKAVNSYREVQKSLETILPALELQMEGWANEVQLLKKHIEASEAAYASVVTQLENKLKIQQASNGASKELTDAHRTIRELQLRLDRFQMPHKQETSSPKGKDDDPFTSLNIFGS